MNKKRLDDSNREISGDDQKENKKSSESNQNPNINTDINKQDGKKKIKGEIEKTKNKLNDVSKKINENKHIKSAKSQIKIRTNRIWGLTLKELKILINDKIAMLIAFALPVTVLIILAVYGATNDISANVGGGGSDFGGRGSPSAQKPIIGFIDYDKTELSGEFKDLVLDYEATGYCKVINSDNQTELERLLGRNEINLILIIPPLFEYNLTIHFPTLLTVVMDTIDTMILQDVQALVDNMVAEFKSEKGFTGVFNPIIHEVGVPKDPGARLIFVASPIFFPMILFSIGCLTATQSIVSDIPKDRMVLTPTNKYEMLFAKTIALQIIMSVLIVITVSLSLFLGLTIRGDIISYFWMLFLIALSGVVWGMLVSALAKVPLNALQYFIFFFLFQTIMLFFMEDPNILNLIPIHIGRKLLTNVTLRGEPWWWAENFQFIRNIFLETIVIYLVTQFVFNKQKTML